MQKIHSVIPRTFCLIFHTDGEVLVLKASSNKKWEGYYMFLGGHIEIGENIIENAKREVKEESGLDIYNTKLRGIMHETNFFGKNVMMFVITCNTDSKEVVANEEGELLWIKPEDFENYKTLGESEAALKYSLKVEDNQMFIGTSEYADDGSLKAMDIKIF